jgi:predicted membrane-bound mannosyltransferase
LTYAPVPAWGSALPATWSWSSAFFTAQHPVCRDVIVHCAASFARSLRAANPVVSAAFLALLIGYFLRGLLPPSDFDGLMYHCAVARLYLGNGGFFHVFFNPQANFPMLTEMNFMLGLAWGNDIICKTMSFGLGAMALAAIAALCKRHCSDSGITLSACLVFMTFTNTIANMSNCYVDIPQAVWTLAAVLFMERCHDTGRRRYALIAGVFCGMAMQTKIFQYYLSSFCPRQKHGEGKKP